MVIIPRCPFGIWPSLFMPQLEEKIKDDLKNALRSLDSRTVSVLRLLISAMQNKEISRRQAGKAELSDEIILDVIQSEVKKRKDSIAAYEQGNRPELAEQEKEEMVILEKYLPAQLSEEELAKIVKEIIETSDDESARNFGKIMGQVMAKVKGQADGNKVSALVKKALDNN